MVQKDKQHERPEDSSGENIAYVRQMLAELRQVAFREGADMLCYLIDMAHIEAGDVQAGRRPRSVIDGERNKTSGVSM